MRAGASAVNVGTGCRRTGWLTFRVARLSKRRRELAVPGLGLASILFASQAFALDVEIDSDASFQVYEVRVPGAGAFLARRRFVAGLGARVVEALTEPDANGRRVRLAFAARLRLDQNFSDDCLVDGSMCVRATDREARSEYLPLAADTRIDVPSLTAEVTGLPHDGLVRAGRQLRFDATGFSRFDGLAVSVRPLSMLGLEAYGGLVVRGTSFAGTSQFDVQGSRYVAAQAPIGRDETLLDPHRDAFVVGGSARAGVGPPFEVAIDARFARDARGEILRRAALSMTSRPLEALRFEAQGVLDLLDFEPIAALAAAEVRSSDASVRLSFDRQVPRFDPSTVWAWLGAAPVEQLRVGASSRLSPDLEIGAALRGRRIERRTSDDFDAGLEGFAQARIEGWRAAASGFLWTGALGPVAGVALDVSRQLVPELGIEGQLSVWHFDDATRVDGYGTVVSTTLSSVWSLTEQAALFLELQHAHTRTVGHRLRATLVLRVMTWR